jgi:hypothetical protein
MHVNRLQPRILRSPAIAIGLASALTLAAVSGCGSSKPYPVQKVSGKITYEDGSLIPAQIIRLVFVPQTPPVDPKTPPKMGRTEVDVKSGSFSDATTFVRADGIIRGEHKVFVQCIVNGVQSRKLIPQEYASAEKTPLKVKTSDSPFDLKVPKPH